MSVHERNGKWVVRWRDDDGANRGMTFDSKEDAMAFDEEMRAPWRSAKPTDLGEALAMAGADPSDPVLRFLAEKSVPSEEDPDTEDIVAEVNISVRWPEDGDPWQS